jgi:3-oxoadipate enol-lactonase
MAHLSHSFRVAAMDFPGYGKSDPIGPRRVSMADLSEMVWGLFQELDIQTAVIGGCSLGSRVAKQFALDHQPHLKALILAGCASGTVSRETMQKQIDGYRKSGISYREEQLRSLVSREFAESALGRHLISLFLETNGAVDVESMITQYRALQEFDVADKLHRVTVPTIIICGEFDPSLPGSRVLHQQIRGSEHRVIQGAGHACAMEKPWEFDALALGFLKSKGLLR